MRTHGSRRVLLAVGALTGAVLVATPTPTSAARPIQTLSARGSARAHSQAVTQPTDKVSDALNPAQESTLMQVLAEQSGQQASDIELLGFHLTTEPLPSGETGPTHFDAVVSPKDSPQLRVSDYLRIQGIVLRDHVEVSLISPGVGKVESRRISIADDGTQKELESSIATVSTDTFESSTAGTQVPQTSSSTSSETTTIQPTGLVGGTGRSAVTEIQDQTRRSSIIRSGVPRIAPAGGFEQDECVTTLDAPVLIEDWPDPGNTYIEGDVAVICTVSVFVQNHLHLILNDVDVHHSYLEGLTYPSWLYVFNHAIADDCIPIWAAYQYYSTESSTLSRVGIPGVLYNSLVAGPRTIGCWASPWN